MDNEAKHRILFVCHGNICRSPMAEFVMKDLVKKAGLEDNFMIESAATSIILYNYGPRQQQPACQAPEVVSHW